MCEDGLLVSITHLEFSNYYKQCHAELTAMKNNKFEGTLVTYSAFLKQEPKDVLARYVRNSRFVEEFETISVTRPFTRFMPRVWRSFSTRLF